MPDNLFVEQHLSPILLRAVVVIVMYHGTAAVEPELYRRHRLSRQVLAEVFNAPPGTPGLLREEYLLVMQILCLQIPPLLPVCRGPADELFGRFSDAMDVVECPFGNSVLPRHMHDTEKSELLSKWSDFNVVTPVPVLLLMYFQLLVSLISVNS
nr:hypothetical protein [Enterobacter sp. 148H3]